MSPYSPNDSPLAHPFPFSTFNDIPLRFCLLAVARSSNSMLNRSGKSGHPCFLLDLSEKCFSFCPWYMMLAVGLSYTVFILLRNYPSISNLLSVFIINGYCTLINAFPHLLIRPCDFCLCCCLCDVLHLFICE